MPVVSVKRDELFHALGKTYTQEEFEALCFEYGLELDDVSQEEPVIYKVEVPANRYDLLCLEGLARALRIFNQVEKPPVFKTVVPQAPQRMVIKPSVVDVRPFVVCAVLRNVTFTQTSYDSFIELQDKLHQNICRGRTLVSVGTHDLDTIQGPFSYEARKPEDIKFVHLGGTDELNGHELMVALAKGHLKSYLPIIKDKPMYPVIYDSNGVVLSLPPIINGEHSKIKLSTKNVFIEVTAVDLTKANIVLNTIVAMFSEYCSEAFSVEVVETVDENGKVLVYPDMTPREEHTALDYINGTVGVKLDAEHVASLLSRMSLEAKVAGNGSEIVVSVPVTRSDVLHACDIAEDVAIAFGYNNIKFTVPATYTVGRQQPISKFSDLLRNEIAQAGYTEIFTLSLCRRKENFEALRRPDDGSAVILANPATLDFEVGRTNLLVGGLKTLGASKHHPRPVKIFEVSDVLLRNTTSDVGAINSRHLAAFYSNTASGFEIIHGLLDRVMTVLGVPPHKTEGYYIRPSEDEAFFPERRADVLLRGAKVGVFGIVHPEVLEAFDISYPVSALELDIEPFLHTKLALLHGQGTKEKETEERVTEVQI